MGLGKWVLLANIEGLNLLRFEVQTLSIWAKLDFEIGGIG